MGIIIAIMIICGLLAGLTALTTHDQLGMFAAINLELGAIALALLRALAFLKKIVEK